MLPAVRTTCGISLVVWESDVDLFDGEVELLGRDLRQSDGGVLAHFGARAEHPTAAIGSDLQPGGARVLVGNVEARHDREE